MGLQNYHDRLHIEIIKALRLNQDHRKIMDRIDTRQLQAIRAKYDPSQLYYKYLNAEKHIRVNLGRAYALGLHQMTGLNILDIGTGSGFFPFVCAYFGHRAISIDKGDNPIFDDMIGLLQVDRTVSSVQAFQRLPDLGRQFDLVTAFRGVFHRINKPVWGVPEWTFFLNDVASDLLLDDGRLFMDLNRGSDKRPYQENVRKLFLSYGARLSGTKVYFPSMKAFQTASAIQETVS
jgi:hypothetical protein